MPDKRWQLDVWIKLLQGLREEDNCQATMAADVSFPRSTLGIEEARGYDEDFPDQWKGGG